MIVSTGNKVPADGCFSRPSADADASADANARAFRFLLIFSPSFHLVICSFLSPYNDLSVYMFTYINTYILIPYLYVYIYVNHGYNLDPNFSQRSDFKRYLYYFYVKM